MSGSEFGRFVDSTAQSANTARSCLGLVATPKDINDGISRVFIPAYIQRSNKVLLAGFDFDKRYATLNASTSSVNLNRAKYFIAVPAVKPNDDNLTDMSRRNLGVTNDTLLKSWITSLVPDINKPENGCALLDEAVQRHFLVEREEESAVRRDSRPPTLSTSVGTQATPGTSPVKVSPH